MNVLEALERATRFLEAKGVASPRLDAELLLADVLQMERLRLYLEFDRPLDEQEIVRSRALFARRGKREPLQYVRVSQEFYSLDFEVGPGVLIPRPETEFLVERAVALASTIEAPKILDLGTGSGAIAISIASELPRARVVAVDIDERALTIARRNAAKHSVESRVEVLSGDWLDPVRTRSFDLVVSNPPYIPTAEIDGLEPEVREHEPRGALDGGLDGLHYARILAREAAAVLEPGGSILVEIGAGQMPRVESLFTEFGWTGLDRIRDLAGIDRVLVATRGSAP